MPTVVFCFSKKKCDEAAESLRQTDLSDGTSEKAQVHTVFELALSRLSPADRELPQLLRVKEMLKRGIGVHHAGLLPIVKEVCRSLHSLLQMENPPLIEPGEVDVSVSFFLSPCHR